MGWPSENARNFVKLDIKMDFQGNLHLFVATSPATENKVDRYAFILTEKPTLKVGDVQCQMINEIKDSLHAEINALRDGIREPSASRFFVKLPAQPKSNGQSRSLVWLKEAIAPNNYLCVAEIVLLKAGMYLARVVVKSHEVNPTMDQWRILRAFSR
ncbi:hypothetical protein AC1031_007942 [Aphanomyces cochlioides]|nr:hypothetical protein AC1031_007942 [Aphanomyces cochlioides]